MSSERAIIDLVITGVGQFDAANDKIQADLTSTERAGKQAETAVAAAARTAIESEKAARTMARTMNQVLTKLERGVHLAQRAAEFAGIDRDSTGGQALDLAGSVLSGAHEGYSYGKAAGPEIGAATAAVFAVIRGAQSVTQSAERAEAAAKKLENQSQDEIVNALIREAALGRVEHSIAPRGRRIQ